MVEVGFREQTSLENTSSNSGTNGGPSVKSETVQPPAPPPRPDQRGNKGPDKPEGVTEVSGSGLRQPPPPVPRNSFKRPEVPPQLKTDEGNNTAGVSKPLPPPPKRPSVPNKQLVSPQDESNEPKPQNLLLPTPVVKSRVNSNVNSNNDNVNTNSVDIPDDPSALYAVINKPKKPTIIRPGKPSVKTGTEPKPDSSPIQIHDLQTETGSSDQNVPEFLRKRLKPTVNTEGEPTDNPTSVQGPILQPRPAPPLKPQVGTKPSLAAKPMVSAKPVIESAINSSVDTAENKGHTFEAKTVNSEQNSEQTNFPNQTSKPNPVRKPTIIRLSKSFHSGSVDNVQESNTNSSATENSIDNLSKPQPPPPKPRRPASVAITPKPAETDTSVHKQDLDTILRRQREPDTSNNEPGTQAVPKMSPRPSPRPAARTRPVSMMISPVARPPLPKHSFTTDDTQNKESHSHISNNPPRPPSKSPTKPQTSPSEHKNSTDHHPTHTNTEEAPAKPHRMSVHKIGVSVFPQLKPVAQQKPEPESKPEPSPPPKPTHGPQHPPPPARPGKPVTNVELDDTDSSQDEDFVIAKDRPERPPGRSFMNKKY